MSHMKEIAYTTFGRNALVIGLISHVTALLVAMMPVSGADSFFSILYPFYWLTFISGVYKELSNRSYKPSINWCFYMVMLATAIPILGPTTGLMMLYGMQGNGKERQDKPLGFLTSVLRLRANVLLIFLFLTIFFILFAVMLVRNDPYFKRKAANRFLHGAAFAAEKPEFIPIVSGGKYAPFHLRSDWGRDESFFLTMTAQAVSGNEDEITEEEYRVYTDFFKTKEVPKIDSPVPLSFPAKGGLVYEKTSSGKKMSPRLLQHLEKSSGKLDASLIDHYNNRNTKDYRIQDKIFVNKIKILTEGEMDEIRKKGGLGKGFAQELMNRYPLAGEIIYLSRVGFNSDMSNALFYAGSSSGLMGASYFIWMEKTGNAWRLKNAVLGDFWH